MSCQAIFTLKTKEFIDECFILASYKVTGEHWPSGRVLDSRSKVPFSPAVLRCVQEQELVLVQTRKTRPDVTENVE